MYTLWSSPGVTGWWVGERLMGWCEVRGIGALPDATCTPSLQAHSTPQRRRTRRRLLHKRLVDAHAAQLHIVLALGEALCRWGGACEARASGAQHAAEAGIGTLELALLRLPAHPLPARTRVALPLRQAVAVNNDVLRHRDAALLQGTTALLR